MRAYGFKLPQENYNFPCTQRNKSLLQTLKVFKIILKYIWFIFLFVSCSADTSDFKAQEMHFAAGITSSEHSVHSVVHFNAGANVFFIRVGFYFRYLWDL